VLYDMTSDRMETNDLTGQMPDRVAAMSRLYDAGAARTGVKPWTGEQTETAGPIQRGMRSDGASGGRLMKSRFVAAALLLVAPALAVDGDIAMAL
jgi:hypothetical protein